MTWAGFSANYRRIEAGQTLVGAEPRALWNLPVAAALESLADEENGRIYLDGRGYFWLEAAGHRKAGAHTSARATLAGYQRPRPLLSPTWFGTRGKKRD